MDRVSLNRAHSAESLSNISNSDGVSGGNQPSSSNSTSGIPKHFIISSFRFIGTGHSPQVQNNTTRTSLSSEADFTRPDENDLSFSEYRERDRDAIAYIIWKSYKFELPFRISKHFIISSFRFIGTGHSPQVQNNTTRTSLSSEADFTRPDENDLSFSEYRERDRDAIAVCSFINSESFAVVYTSGDSFIVWVIIQNKVLL
ncbi:unnamed protein product [Gongylonema pulchrum]|uniref:Uncharacterized protein n=1 Tax=Gongylonema pulchrum TaxID=637853 RepID=A0A3P7NRV2_9BILA|nr:unnamed protein product [Gongylonema pulchrum]